MSSTESLKQVAQGRMKDLSKFEVIYLLLKNTNKSEILYSYYNFNHREIKL